MSARSNVEPTGGDAVGPAGRPPAILVADHPALDFVNSRAFPGGKEVEWIADGRDLVAWLAAAGLGDRANLASLAEDLGPRRLDAAAAQARELREWFREWVGRHTGKPLAPTTADELGPLNDLLGKDNAFRSVATRPAGKPASGSECGPLVWRRHRRLPAAQVPLLPVADAMGDLLTAEDFTLVRQCEGTGCSLVFLDRTKNHLRRWCSIAWCGNRAKAAAHRARQRGLGR